MTINTYGRASKRSGPPAVRQDWGRCAAFEASAAGGEWVPAATVKVVPGLTPRLSAIDEEQVAAYAENFAALPPLMVQRDTFVLIDGMHRLHAAYKELSNFVRIVEVDVADGDLADWALRYNIAHGLRLTARERTSGAKALMLRHPEWSNRTLQDWTGMHQSNFTRWRAEAEHKAAAATDRLVNDRASGVENSTRDNRVVGQDGKSYPKVSPRTYTPPPEPWPDDEEEAEEGRPLVSPSSEKEREYAVGRGRVVDRVVEWIYGLAHLEGAAETWEAMRDSQRVDARRDLPRALLALTVMERAWADRPGSNGGEA